MIEDGVIVDYPEFSDNRDRTRRLTAIMSEDNRDSIETKIFIKQLLDATYYEHHTEIEMLILSSSNYTHMEISEVLNISRLGVTKRIAKAREILSEKVEDMLGNN